MDFMDIAATLKKSGYSPKKADAKIAHDIVLKAIEDAGFHDKVTIKGGVVMSGITDAVRRATIDMDVDFLGYSLGDASIQRFVRRLNRVADCDIRIDGPIVELRQKEYKGKRINLALTDEAGRSIRTKIDIGVHSDKFIQQEDFQFKVITDTNGVVLLVNPKEQMFVEKLKSLLRFGVITTRYKDVYDLFYLLRYVNAKVLSDYLRICVFENPTMLENDVKDIERRLARIFSSKTFLKRMANPDYAWIDESVDVIVNGLLDFFKKL
ncbi:MAG: nucleotidyl transferase AbiEii/AbiGii toxin family protein [Acutalibacteraceae bacterium]